MERIFQSTEIEVNKEMNDTLLKEFTPMEVKFALDQMNTNKASGPDGMVGGFYKKYWGITRQDITHIILDCLNGNEQLQAINHTNLVLIPKIKHLPLLRTFNLSAFVM